MDTRDIRTAVNSGLSAVLEGEVPAKINWWPLLMSKVTLLRFRERRVYSQILEDRFVGTAKMSWPTRTIKHNNATFFFKMRKVSDNYQLEVVMKGSLTDCRLFTTEISILDYDSEEAVFKTSFQPRPIDTEQWGTKSILKGVAPSSSRPF